MLTAMDAAMKDEGIEAPLRERVINRLVYGDPEGPRAVHRISEDAQQAQIHISEPAALADPLLRQIRARRAGLLR
jgi:hypothetical protein